MSRRLNFIDLFAGAGGLSEGFIRAGFLPLAHVEMGRYACETLRTRTAYHYLRRHRRASGMRLYRAYERGVIPREELLKSIPPECLDSVLCAEMSAETIGDIFSRIDGLMAFNDAGAVDLIIGGPPCQAYSMVGRAQTSHMTIPMEKDPRNTLYLMYMRFINRYQPAMFVFENVQGITTARGGEVYKNLKSGLRRAGYEIDCREQNAMNFNVLQSRARMIIIGWRKGTKYHYPDFNRTTPDALVQDLLSDLPPVARGETKNEYSVDYANASAYVREHHIREEGDILTHHTARPNTERDVKIYRLAIEAWQSGRRLKYTELPPELQTHRNHTSFKDRFKVVEGDRNFCHTVVAHLSKDGHYFIHPDIRQCRSITVREAARLQSFPDNYYFEGPRTSQFVQIGNAVPPLMAERIAGNIKAQLESR